MGPLSLALLLAAALPARAFVGNADETTRHPAVVMLELDGAAHCSGSIVAPETVLTAAHCVEGLPPDKPGLIVREGGWSSEASAAFADPGWEPAALDSALARLNELPTWETMSTEQRALATGLARDIERIWRHDLAVLKLSKASPAAPLALPKLGENPLGLTATIVGYGGADREDPSATAGIKRHAPAVIQAKRGAFLNWGGSPKPAPKKKGARRAALGAIVEGDSGGALVSGPILLAVNVGYDTGSSLAPALTAAFGAPLVEQPDWNFALDLAAESSVKFLETAAYKGFSFGPGSPERPSPAKVSKALATWVPAQ